MDASSRAVIGLVIVAMVAWTVYCLFFLVLLGVPSIEGAAEIAERARLTIIGGWLLGLAVGTITVVGLSRGAFDSVPRRLRVRLAVTAFVVSAVLVVALYWLELSGMLLFLWGPLVGALVLVAAWAATPSVRRRLGVALIGWILGFAALAALWFVLPPGTLSFHFWTLLGLVTLAAVAWWVWPLLTPRASRT